MHLLFVGTLRPDDVIPFKLDKNAAKAALIKHYGGKRLFPKVFMEQNHIDEEAICMLKRGEGLMVAIIMIIIAQTEDKTYEMPAGFVFSLKFILLLYRVEVSPMLDASTSRSANSTCRLLTVGSFFTPI